MWILDTLKVQIILKSLIKKSQPMSLRIVFPVFHWGRVLFQNEKYFTNFFLHGMYVPWNVKNNGEDEGEYYTQSRCR